MKRFINKIQDFYLRLDKMLLLGVLVILGVLTFILNFMWAMPKTFCFLAGALAGWIIPILYRDAHSEPSSDEDEEYKSTLTKDINSQAQNISKVEYNDWGQPRPASVQSQSLED